MRLVERDHQQPRCAICHDDAKTLLDECKRCATRFHFECFAEHGQCPTLGCVGDAVVASLEPRTTDAMRRVQQGVLVAISVAGLSVGVVSFALRAQPRIDRSTAPTRADLEDPTHVAKCVARVENAVRSLRADEGCRMITAVELTVWSDARAWSAIGRARLDAGMVDSARDILFLAARLEPENATIQARVGALALALGNEELANAHWTRALELDPACVEALVDRGTLRLRTGDVRGANVDLAAALARDPGSARVLVGAARGLFLAGLTDAANVLADEARRLAPRHAVDRALSSLR
jgi:Flp pilus assembly protein TadD